MRSAVGVAVLAFVCGCSGGDDDPGDPVELPPGSREYDGIVNLVDARVAEDLDRAIVDKAPAWVNRSHSLDSAFNLFVESYLEQYDFVFFFTDHPREDAPVAAFFQAVNRPAQRGTGNEIDVAVEGYRSNGTVKGVAAFNYGVQDHAEAHEVAHYWANFLDPGFGFGVPFSWESENVTSHWGPAGVHGQLGGFDPDSLRCRFPEGGSLPDCEPDSNDRMRYLVNFYSGGGSNVEDLPYAPLELYTMGLLDGGEVPDTPVLMNAAYVDLKGEPLRYDIAASEVRYVSVDELQERHGTPRFLNDDERAFRTAFVVISAEPADDEVLEEVAAEAAVFGARRSLEAYSSFEEKTGGRATMVTELGERRTTNRPPPAPRGRFACDVMAQNCPRPELACVVYGVPSCMLAGTAQLGEACDYDNACERGLVCEPYNGICKPYCDLEYERAAKGCLRCPSDYTLIESEEGDFAFCN